MKVYGHLLMTKRVPYACGRKLKLSELNYRGVLHITFPELLHKRFDFWSFFKNSDLLPYHKAQYHPDDLLFHSNTNKVTSRYDSTHAQLWFHFHLLHNCKCPPKPNVHLWHGQSWKPQHSHHFYRISTELHYRLTLLSTNIKSEINDFKSLMLVFNIATIMSASTHKEE